MRMTVSALTPCCWAYSRLRLSNRAMFSGVKSFQNGGGSGHSAVTLEGSSSLFAMVYRQVMQQMF